MQHCLRYDTYQKGSTMCIPPFIPYVTLGIVSGYFVILAIFYSEHWSHFAAAVIAGIIQSRIKCPNCKKPILQAPNGWYLFTVRPKCRHCGYNTMQCKEDSLGK